MAWSLALLLLFSLLGYGGYRAIRSPKVQTYITQFLASKLSEKLGARVEVGGVDIGFFNRLILEGFYIEDTHGDTLGYIQRLHVGLAGFSLENRQVLVDRITLDSLFFHLHKYEGEQAMNIQFILDFLKTEKDTTAKPIWDLRFREVHLNGATFRYYDETKSLTGRGIDYRHLHISEIDLLIKNIRIDSDTILGRVDRMAFTESHGFHVDHLAGDVKVSPIELKVDGLRIKTPESEIALNLHYTYSKWGDWLNFLEDVRMDYDIEDSRVGVSDVAFFVPPLDGLEKTVRISGKVHGPVSSIRGRGLNVWYGLGTNLQGDVDLDGLPDIHETFMFLNLKRLVTNHGDLTTIPLPPFDNPTYLPVPANVKTLGNLHFQGNFTGFITDFVAFGRLRTDIGELRTDLSLKQDIATEQYSYKGKVAGTDFNIGRFMGLEHIGRVSLDASVDGKGLTAGDVNASLNGKVHYVELRDYAYRNIDVNGTFIHEIFEGELCIAEENIALDFLGMVDLSGKLPRFNFQAEVAHANLYRLKLLEDREDATVTGNMDVNFTGDDIDNILGQIVLSGVSYQQKGDKRYTFSDFWLKATEQGGRKTIDLRSDIMDAQFVGQFAFRNIPKAVNNIIAKHLPSYGSGFITLEAGEGFEFDFSAEVKNTAIVSYFVAPKLDVGENSHFKGSYSTSRNMVRFEGLMPKFRYDSIVFTGVSILAENPGKEFGISVMADDIHFTDSLFIANLEIQTHTFNDSLGLSIVWDNRTKLENSAEINGVASFPRNAQVRFHLEDSRITVADLGWQVRESNILTIDSTTFHFRDFTFHNREQSIGLNGFISKDPDKVLNVAMNAFNLANLNLVTIRSGITLDGRVSGNAAVSNLYGRMFLTNRVQVDSLRVNSVMIGSGQVNNIWKPEERLVDVMADLKRSDGTGLQVTGVFMPGADRDRNFDLVMRADNLPVSLAAPYVSKVLSQLKGTARIDLTLKGTTRNPELEGYVDLNRVSMLFDYLNTSFRINDRILVKKDGFYMNDLKVMDERGKEGTVNGWVKHTGFKDMRFDAVFTLDNFFALNTTSALNQLYYGRAFGSGVVHFSGVPGDMHLDLSMRTERGSRFFIPLFGAKNVKETDFITFVRPKGADEEVDVPDDLKVEFANLTMDLDIQVTPDAEVQLIFDPTVGDIIRASGMGDIRLALDRNGEFKMFGQFNITKGDYLFTLQNIINKRFSVKPGGRVSWSGSPYNAQVDLEAVYGLRATLADLMYPDTSLAYQRRIQVECVLRMQESLMNPSITFDINLPNADQTTRADVINRIGVGNEQEMNRQVFGLLVLNKFMPTEDQNFANETGGFFSANSAEMLSNQLSNWLSRISSDFDVGLNYRPGSDASSDEVEVALSTQLFNNRVVVDGNVGVANSRNAQAGQSSSNIVGDVNIEYKITSDGRFRVRAFNRSNDVGANALISNNAPFTQGVGLSYRKEFNSFADLFRKEKKKEKTKIQLPNMTPKLPEEMDSDQLDDMEGL